jgi:outer membrane protein OmpA-like peptidoglycan-associated protein
MVKKSLASKRKAGLGYPKHTSLSYLVCFNKSCINRAESILFRKKYRFKGYKNGTPPEKKAPSQKEEELPVISHTPAIEGKTEPILFNKVYTFKHVYFQTGEAVLNVEAQEELNQLVELLQKNSALSISVSGHTDNTGNSADNIKLSQLRAETVIKYLADKGIAADRLRAKGYGSSKPIATNTTVEGREINRRVEFILQN